MTRIIMVDLDGVLNCYDGNYKEDEISPMRDGAREFLKELSTDYRIEIFTVRNKKLTLKWLEDNNLADFVSDITDVKNPFASVYIDDRCLNFSGDFANTIHQIKNFKPYWK